MRSKIFPWEKIQGFFRFIASHLQAVHDHSFPKAMPQRRHEFIVASHQENVVHKGAWRVAGPHHIRSMAAPEPSARDPELLWEHTADINIVDPEKATENETRLIRTSLGLEDRDAF